MTALTVNGSAAAATTLAAAGKLFAATGGTSGNTSTKVGTSTGYKHIYAKGFSGTSLVGAGSLPAPTDSNFNGWLWDVTTLEGQRIAAGTWTPTMHLLASTSTTVTPTVEWYKRSSGGVYTQIGTVTGSSIALTTSSQLLVFTAPSLALMDFAAGDKLAMWLWVNQTAGGATNSTISVVEATSGSSAGVASEAQAVTPGYAPIPVALAATMAGRGQLSPSVYAPVILADSPIRYYRLGESSDTTAVDSGSQAQNGTLNGGITLSHAGLVTGDTNTSELFNGSTGYISLPTTGLPTGASAWSVECWLSLTSVPGGGNYWNALALGATGAGNNFSLYFDGDQQKLGLGMATNVFVTLTITAGHTYYCAGTWDGTTATLYLYDATAGTFANASQTPTATLSYGTVNIGAYIDATGNWNGTIDEVAIYSTTLSATQVAAHYTAGTQGFALLVKTALTCTLAGAGTLTATLSTSGVALSATIAGAGTLSGTSTLSTVLSSPSTGIGTLTGTFTLATTLSSTQAGTGLLSPTLAARLTLPSTTLPGAGTLVAALSGAGVLAATLPGAGVLTGTPALATSLTGQAAGNGTLTGTLSLPTALTGQLSGSGMLTGTMAERLALSETMAGTGIFAGALSATTSLLGQCAGSGALAGVLMLQTALGMTGAGIGQLSGVFSLQTALFLTCAGAGTLAGQLVILGGLAATCAGVGTLAGAVSYPGPSATATWVTRDHRATWVARDEKAVWNTRR